ncbi:MAG: MogA/MoaB family molybdenum cofactor biosynthesis protein [Candidatus Dormibacteraceae bacterium]
MAPVVAAKTCILTVSDRSHQGERPDTTGPALERVLSRAGFDLTGTEIVPDNREQIIDFLLTAVSEGHDLIVTNGGTGLGPRDMTPEATLSVVDYQVPGIAEAMRLHGMKKTPLASLSRAVAGVRGRTLIINLPGSQKAALESLDAIIGVIPHAVQLLRGDTEHR